MLLLVVWIGCENSKKLLIPIDRYTDNKTKRSFLAGVSEETTYGRSGTRDKQWRLNNLFPGVFSEITEERKCIWAWSIKKSGEFHSFQIASCNCIRPRKSQPAAHKFTVKLMVCRDATSNIMSVYSCLVYYKHARFIGHFLRNSRLRGVVILFAIFFQINSLTITTSGTCTREDCSLV